MCEEITIRICGVDGRNDRPIAKKRKAGLERGAKESKTERYCVNKYFVTSNKTKMNQIKETGPNKEKKVTE